MDMKGGWAAQREESACGTDVPRWAGGEGEQHGEGKALWDARPRVGRRGGRVARGEQSTGGTDVPKGTRGKGKQHGERKKAQRKGHPRRDRRRG